MADIGAMLREARMREHLDIAEFETRTKIRAKYLRALEDEEWSLLPGYTFTKSFLRTYADMLGLDGRQLVDEFKRQYPDPSEIELATVMPSRRDARRTRERPGERGKRQSGPSGRVLAIAVLVVLIAAAVFVVRELEKKKGGHHTTTTTSTTTTHTTTTHTTHHAPAVSKVALKLTATSSVQVCLIGYVSSHGVEHQRVPAAGSATPTALLTPGERASGSASPTAARA
jgi:cytoskeletal protein RodZ